MRRLTLALIIVLATGALSGCGDDDEDSNNAQSGDRRAEVVDAVKEFQTTALDRDADAYCDLLTGDLKRELTARVAPLGAKTCEDAADKAFELGGGDEFAEIKKSRDRLDRRDVRLAGNRATVTLPVSGRRMQLERVGGDWYVSKIPGN